MPTYISWGDGARTERGPGLLYHDDLYLGIDVGSVSTNLIVANEQGQIVYQEYLRTQGRPIPAVQEGLAGICRAMPGIKVRAVGTTGSGRQLAAAIVGADVVKMRSQPTPAAIHFRPDVQTVIEIGGQIQKSYCGKVCHRFAINTVCAAGTDRS